MVAVIVQIFVVIFASFAWSRVFMRFKDHQMNLSAFFLWTIVWIGIVIATLVPNLSHAISNSVGIDRALDFFVYTSIILLLYLVFRLYVKIETSDHEITRLIRALAIDRVKRSNK